MRIPSLLALPALCLLVGLGCGRAGAEKPYDHISVRVDPAAAVVTADLTKIFTAEVTNSAQGVAWSVPEAEGGSILPSGLYTAPSATGTFHIVGTSLENSGRSGTATVKVVLPPVIDAFTASAEAIQPGTPVTLLPLFSGGSARLEPGIGAVSSGKTLSVSPSATTTYTLTVTNEAGTKAAASITITVGTVPVIQDLTAFPALVSTGGSCTLIPTFSGGSGTISPVIGEVASGLSYTVNPTATTTYTLSVSGNGATVTRQVMVQVVPPPTILSFQASPNPILRGSTAALSATFLNGTATISPGVGPVTSGQLVTVRPLETCTYTLSVVDPAGTRVSQELMLEVVGIQAFSADPATVTRGNSSTLLPVFSGGEGSITPGVGFVHSGEPVTITPGATTSYTLTVTHPGGLSTSSICTVTVVDPPAIASFSAAPNPVTVGQGATLSAVFSAGEGSIDQGVGPVTSGQAVRVSPVRQTLYTLTVTNAAGVSATASVDLAVAPMGSFALTGGPIGTPRQAHTATRLADGRVLIAGGSPIEGGGPPVLNLAELYDPGTGLFSPTSALGTPRQDHSAVRLADGRVLLVGGSSDGTVSLNSAEIYDPVLQTFIPTPGTMNATRIFPSTALLADGRVLVSGGAINGLASAQASADLFDPATGLFTPTSAPMASPRFQHASLTLADGSVLLAGGVTVLAGTPTPLASAEIFDPLTGVFTPTASTMTTGRQGLTLTPAGGSVFVAGGLGFSATALAQTEIYSPATRSFSASTPLGGSWPGLLASLLNDGRIFLVGVGGARIFDPPLAAMLEVNGTGDLATGSGTATTLGNGKVLIVNLEGGRLFDPLN